MTSTPIATTATRTFAASQQSRLAALTLSAVFTLGMLMGIHTLAALDDAAPQMAQTTQPRA